MVKKCTNFDFPEYKNIVLNILKAYLYVQIRDFLHTFKKDEFKALIRKRELKNFIDKKVDLVYEKIQFLVFLGIYEENAVEIVLNDLFLNKFNNERILLW